MVGVIYDHYSGPTALSISVNRVNGKTNDLIILIIKIVI